MPIKVTRKEAYIIDIMGSAEDTKSWVVIGNTARFYKHEKAAIHRAERSGGFPMKTHEAIAEGIIEVID